MSEEYKIRKEVGKLRKISPLQRAHKFKKMLEALRGERIEERDENIRRIIGRVKQGSG